MGLVDSHAHLAPTPEARDKLIRLMDELSIDLSVIVGGGSMTPHELSQQIATGGSKNVDIGNRALLNLTATSEGRLTPFFFANPHRAPNEYELEGKAYSGLKLGPAVHGVMLLDERNLAYVTIARQFHHPVYLHCLGRPGFLVSDLVDLAKRFPKVNFILGHAGIGNCDFFAVNLIEAQKNIFFETSGGFSSVVAAAIKQLGIDRVLFGSEYPLQHPRIEIEKAKCLGLSEEAFHSYTRGNILSLIGDHRA